MRITRTDRHIFTFTAKEDNLHLSMEIENGELVNFKTNLPYRKSLDDWEFYGKAIVKIVREWKKKGEEIKEPVEKVIFRAIDRMLEELENEPAINYKRKSRASATEDSKKFFKPFKTYANKKTKENN